MMKNKLELQDIKDTVVDEQYHRFTKGNTLGKSTLTVCCLTLKNGYQVTGESACVDPDNFDVALGKELAKENAIRKIWTLEGYLLKQEFSAR